MLAYAPARASRSPRGDAAIIAVFTATGRLSELAGIRYHPDDPARSDLDLDGREIRIRGKGSKSRTVKIGHQAARSLVADTFGPGPGTPRRTGPSSR